MVIDYDYLAKEYAKCFKDKSRIYMIQNYLKTFDNTQKKLVPFQLFPKQQELCKTIGSDSTSICCTKARQMGITTTMAAYLACEMCLAEKEYPQTVLAIGNTLETAHQILTKVREFLLQFPLWMWGDEFIEGKCSIRRSDWFRTVKKNGTHETAGKEVA